MYKAALYLGMLFLIFSGNLQALNLRKVPNSDVSGSLVNSVWQDNRGVVWIGTTTGLYSYDGENTYPIVFKSGFSNRASFYRAFSKKHGCAPTEFREKSNI